VLQKSKGALDYMLNAPKKLTKVNKYRCGLFISWYQIINHASRLILVCLEKFSSISVNIIVPFGEKEFFDDVILALFKESNQLYEKLEWHY